MACTLTGIDQSSLCVPADGGIKSYYVVGFDDVVTLTAGTGDNEISAVALTAVTGTLIKFVPDEVDAQNMEEGARFSSRLTNFTQTVNSNFKSLSSASALAVQNLEQCCEGLVIFTVHNQIRPAGTDPIIRILGLQLTDTSGGFKQLKNPLRTSDISIDSGTIDGEAQITLAFSGVATKPAPYFTGTVADLDALVL